MNQKKVDARIIQTRQKLSNALTELLNLKPFEELTVTDLVNQARINRSTFYLHYNGLEDFISDLENDLYNHFRNQMITFFKTETGWLDQIINPDLEIKFSILEYILDAIEKSPQIQAFIKARLYNSEFLLKIVEDGYESAYASFSKAHTHIEASRFRYFYSFAAMGCVGLIFNWIQSGMDKSTEEISHLAHTLVKQSIKSIF